jgi:hypothetical protein
LVIYTGIAVFGLSIIFIAVAVGQHSDELGRAALALVLAGPVVILAGLFLAGLSLARSADAVTYAVEEDRRLGLASLAYRATGVDMSSVPLKDSF